VEHQFYIRIRGRILGPYDEARFQSLARRGQLSRMHEVSLDSINWVPASKYPDLFTNADTPQATGVPPALKAAEQAETRNFDAPTGVGRLWWYRKNGAQVGPVAEAEVRQYLVSGMLSGDDFVWSEGMPQWVPARQAPALGATQASPIATNDFRVETDQSTYAEPDLTPSLCRAAGNSRNWVLFIAIAFFINAGFSLVGGIFLLVMGANHHLSPAVAQGLFALMFSIDATIGGCLLMTYANRLAGLRYGSRSIVLEKSLDTLRSFWVYVSINLILLLGIIAFFAIWVIAFAGSMPWNY
jgi:hypothetical protein